MLTSMEQEHLDRLRKGIIEKPMDRYTFKWALEVALLERYASDPDRDPSTWPKGIKEMFSRPGAGEEWRNRINRENALPTCVEFWFEWTPDHAKDRIRACGVYTESEIERIVGSLSFLPKT